MYSAFLQRTNEALSALVSHIQITDSFRNAIFNDTLECSSKDHCLRALLNPPAGVPNKTEWRKIDHCAAITRVYAIYEQFVQEMIREHLSILQISMMFIELPETVQHSYRAGISRILEKKDGPRFGDLDLGQLVVGYGDALSGKRYILEPKAMLMQEQNLRLPELHRLMNACGIDHVESWITRHKAVIDFFCTGGRLSTTVESQLAELIKYRNDAAHGSIDVDSILHPNVLIECCKFIGAICNALSERVQLAGLKSLQKHGKAHTRGKVTELLRNKMVSIGTMAGSFTIGEVVYLCGDNYCLERKIESLQISDVSYNTVNLTESTELGFMFDAPGRINAEVMAFVAYDVTPSARAPAERENDGTPIDSPDSIERAVSAGPFNAI